MADNTTQRMAPADVLKDILLWGAAALGLFGPIVGLRTISDTATNRTILDPRWLMLGIFILAVMALRAYFVLKPKRQAAAAPLFGGLGAAIGESATILTWVGFGLVLAFPIVMLYWKGPAGSLKWIDSYGIMILIYVMLGWGLNVVVGLAGLLDLGYVAFYAVGAYAYAILASNYGFTFWVLLPLAGILAAFWGIILGFPVLRLRGDYLAIVTLAFGEIIHKVLINWKDFSHGNDGILNLPTPTVCYGIEFGKDHFLGIPWPSLKCLPFQAGPDGVEAFLGLATTPRILPLVHSKIFLFYVVLALVVLVGYVTTRLRRLPVGRAWEALREDEVACRSLGIDTTKTKLAAFATGALIGGLAGCCFGARQAYVNPESFVFMESVVVLAIVVLGGMGSLFGVALAAFVMIGGMELLRELDVLKAVFGAEFDASQYRFLLFGLAMVFMMLWKPRGIISNRTPTAFLKERKVVSGDLVKEGHG